MGPSLSVPELLIGMIEAYGAPRPLSFGYGELLEDLVQAIAEFGTGGGPSVKSVLAYGADPTGQVESTNAFNEALAALPTINVVNNGIPRTVSYGTITGGGRFLVNLTEHIQSFGPFVMFDGLGFTFLDDWNSDNANPYCLGLINPHGFPGSAIPPIQAGPQLQYWTGGMRGVTIDGTNATATGAMTYAGPGGAGGVEILSGEYFLLQHCKIQNYPNGPGLYLLSNGTGWMESHDIDLQCINVLDGVLWGGVTVGPNAGLQNSQGQSRLWLRVSTYPGQNAITIMNGAWVYHAQIYLTGVMLQGTEPASAHNGAALSVLGAHTLVQHTHIDIRLEMDQLGVNTWTPQTIFLDFANSALIDQCDGYLGFVNFGTGGWKPTHPQVSQGLNSYFEFFGPSFGDTVLTSAGGYRVMAGPANGT